MFDGCEELFGSFEGPNVSCKQLFHKGSQLLSHKKAYHIYKHKETDNHPKQEGKEKNHIFLNRGISFNKIPLRKV